MQLINRFINLNYATKTPSKPNKTIFCLLWRTKLLQPYRIYGIIWIGIDSYANCLNAIKKISSFLYYPLSFFGMNYIICKSLWRRLVVTMFYYMPENIMRRSFCLGYFCVHSEFEQFLSLWWSNKKRTVIIWEGFRSLPLEKTMDFQKRLVFVGRSSNVAASAAVYFGKATKMNQE